MNPEDPRHGTRAGYDAHRRTKVTPCPPCTDAAARYERGRSWDKLSGRPRLLPAAGPQLRLQALVALGWTIPQLGAELDMHPNNLRKFLTQPRKTGTVRTTTARRVTHLYDRWSMHLPPATPYATKARDLANRRGWLPPLALDDDLLDTPGYQPTRPRKHTGLGNQLLDHAVVERVLAGQPRPRKLTNAEAAEIYRRLRARGHSTTEIEHTYGINSKRYTNPSEGDAA